MSEGALGRWLLVGAGIVVVATIATGIFVMGSPSAQRDQAMDQRRVRDLARIGEAIDSYADLHDTLPPTLATLAGQPGRRLSIADPVDGSVYAYEILGNRTYRVCAVFATDTAKAPKAAEPWGDDRWFHGTGRQCFQRKANAKTGRR